MFNIRDLLRQVRFGIAVAALIVIGTALYAQIHGPLYGVWGWLELVLGGADPVSVPDGRHRGCSAPARTPTHGPTRSTT